MRDLKLRIWDRSCRQMTLANLYWFAEHHVHTMPDDLPKRYDVMFSTRRRDTQLHDIYQADILKNDAGILWKVQWNVEKAGFELEWCGGPQPVYPRSGMYLVGIMPSVIVGNLYQNAELASATRAG